MTGIKPIVMQKGKIPYSLSGIDALPKQNPSSIAYSNKGPVQCHVTALLIRLK